MGTDQNGKGCLPYPYSLDLSGVLRRLDRRTEAGRERLANDPVTAAYLAAGMRLVDKILGPGVRRLPVDPLDENSVPRPVLGFLSQRAVAAEVGNNPHPFPRVGSTSTLRSTWKSQSDFIADLLSFGLWSHQYPIARHSEEVAAAKRRLVEGGDFVEATHSLCYWALTTLIAAPTFRLSLLAAAVAEEDEIVARAVADHYHSNRAHWDDIYTTVLAAHGLRLRPGADLDHLSRMLTALADGCALRAVADPGTPIIDHERHRSLLGTAALALILSLGVPAGTTGAGSLEDAVRNMLG